MKICECTVHQKIHLINLTQQLLLIILHNHKSLKRNLVSLLYMIQYRDQNNAVSHHSLYGLYIIHCLKTDKNLNRMILILALSPRYKGLETTHSHIYRVCHKNVYESHLLKCIQFFGGPCIWEVLAYDYWTCKYEKSHWNGTSPWNSILGCVWETPGISKVIVKWSSRGAYYATRWQVGWYHYYLSVQRVIDLSEA